MKNIHKAKFVLIGLVIGLTFSSFFAYADEISQFILTKVSYPVIVNNQEYTSAELPVLNYQGNTYVPLKAIGKLLDAEVKWNDELKRVEIGDSSLLQGTKYETPEESIELSVGETYDNGNAKITFYDLKIISIDEFPADYTPNRTTRIDYKIKVELDENIGINGTVFSGYCITDNEKYNTPENRIKIYATRKINQGETAIFEKQDFNEKDYTIKKINLSFPALNINNLVWIIAD